MGVSLAAMMATAPGWAEIRGLDARLASYDYPYPVRTLPLQAQWQRLELAYMDVAAESTTSTLPRGTVLLLHGKNFSGAYWADTIALLTKQGYRVVVPDQIGFGKSSKPVDYQYGFDAMAAQTAALLDQLDQGSVHVVGHSMGGMLGARFALLFADRTRSLTLVNPIGLEDWRRWIGHVPVGDWYAAEMQKSPDDVREYMRKAYFAGQWKTEYEPLVEIQAGWIAGPDRERMARVSALTYDMILGQPVVHEFPHIAVPTLLIIGQRDRTALGRNRVDAAAAEQMGRYPELGRAAAAAIAGARLVPVDGAGHLPQVEQFDAYATALTGFLADNEHR